MKKKYFTIVTSIVCLMLQSLTLWGQTEMGMYLGDLAFVKAKPSITMEQRTLNMKMSTAGINCDFYSKVGGVSFIQTAIPEFEVNTISCDVVDGISYVIVNGKSYEIPLENWMLKSIVTYANSDKNAAVTLYGGDEIPIKYHPAFMDNLLGLRLLQTDMLMSGMFSRTDLAKIPTYDNRREIITHKEAKSIGGRKEESVSKYEEQSKLAFNEIDNYFESINDKPNTYVYTDYGETISFSANDSLGIQFHGAPYYRFAQLGPDTLEAVKLISSFVDSLESRKELYRQHGGTWFFDNKNYSFLLDLKQQVENKKTLTKNASQIFKDLNFSKDMALLLDVYVKIMAEYESNYMNNLFIQLLGMNQMTNNLIELWKKNDVYLIPFISDLGIDNYIKFAKNLGVDNATVAQIKKSKTQTVKSYIMSAQNWHIWKNASDAVTELPDMTDVFKSKEFRSLIHDTNPLIIDEAETTCQWSALFRYIKEKNPDGWKDFVMKTSSLNDNLPEDLRTIWTPVNLYNSSMLNQLFNPFAQ